MSTTDRVQKQSIAPAPRRPARPRRNERRGARRTMTIYRLVQIECECDEGLARCRNISDTGMMLDCRMAVAVGDEVRVTFSQTFAVVGRVVWTEGGSCGIAFARPIDCADLLRRSADESRCDRARPLRLKTSTSARLFVDGEIHPTHVCDISQRGMCVMHDGWLQPGMRVWIVLPCGAEKGALVRWAHEEQAGLFLSDPFSVEALGSVHAL